ncbi:hypothetical protein SO802_005970 [Lithocarpus litseifolius]|uniref:Transcription factor Iwr1 domain-containing protein n=1 Tax=Lithocarpus litseifolius TaxID=425828 RepID=A0AAW2DM51_9ROSI
MNYLLGINLGRTMKKPTVQVLMIPIATAPFRLGYKCTDDDLLEMEVRKMARAKAKAKRHPCPPEPLKSYTPTLNGKFVNAIGGSLNRDLILSSDSGHDDDDINNDSESNNSEDYDSQYSGNDWGDPTSDREDEDAYFYYEEYDDDVDYYDEDIEDDAEANRWSDTNSDQYKLINVLEDAREEIGQPNDADYDDYPYGHLSDWSCITDVSSRPGPRYDKYGREILELGFYYDSKPGTPTPHTKE